MEENFGSDTRRRNPPALAAHIGCNQDLSRSNSDVSSLTAENSRDIFRRSVNVSPDDYTAWTDEKHISYLNHLEVSFVEQLYQLKSSLAQCSEQNQRELNISEKRKMNVNNDLEQFEVLRNGCWQKLNGVRGEPLSSSTSAASRASFKCKSMSSLKHIGTNCHPSSAKMLAFHGKGMISHGIPGQSQEFSSPNPYDRDLIDLMREGTGQNFLGENNQSTSKFESRAKKLKNSLEDGSHHDQIVPSRKCCTSD